MDLNPDVFGCISALHWVLVKVGRPQGRCQGQVLVRSLPQYTSSTEKLFPVCAFVKLEWVDWKNDGGAKGCVEPIFRSGWLS